MPLDMHSKLLFFYIHLDRLDQTNQATGFKCITYVRIRTKKINCACTSARNHTDGATPGLFTCAIITCQPEQRTKPSSE